MSIITGIINVLTTSPVKEILVNIVAGASLDGIKKIVSNFQKDSVEGQIWCLLSDTMAQFYEQIFCKFEKQLEYDEVIVVKSFLEQFAYYKDSINENHLRCIVEQTIYGNMDILTDREYQLWVSIFADNCSKYPNIYEMYKIQKDIIDNTFTERNLMIQRVVSKLDIFVGNENHTARLFQSVIENLYRLFNFSWKNEILDWISQLPYNRFNQDKITEKLNFIEANEDCELVLSALQSLFNLHDLEKSQYKRVKRLNNFFLNPHFNKVFIVTGTAGAGKSFFIKEYIVSVVSAIEENDISILPCIVDISKINRFVNFEDFVIAELSSFTGKALSSIDEANVFFRDLPAKVCFIIDDLNSQILKEKDWDKLIRGIKKFSKFEQFRWILSIDEYEYYYLECDNSFLNKYCITQTDITQKENQEPTIFCNAFSIDQYNKVQNIVKWILKSQYGIAEQLFSLDVILGITTPKEAHYFGEAVPKGEVIGMPSTYYDYIIKIVRWKNTALMSQKPDGIENDLRKIIDFIIRNHICELDGLDLSTIDLMPFRKVQLVNPLFIKSTSMFDLDQGAMKTSYKINVFPFWAAKMTKMVDIRDLEKVGDLVSFPKELTEWLIPCVIFFNFESYTKKGNEIFEFFSVLNEQHILDYALFCANKTSIVFSKKLFEYLVENLTCYIQGPKDCYSVLYFVFYSKLKMTEKLRLLNTMAEYIPKFGFEKLYERIFCSIINNSMREKNLKKNVLEVALCRVDTVNYINGSNAGAKYFGLAVNQGKEIEMIVQDIIEYIESHPKLLSTISIKEGHNESFMDFFLRRCFEKYLFITYDSVLHIYQRLECFFVLEEPLGIYVKRNLTCAAGNIFVYSKDEKYRNNYILLTKSFVEKDDLYHRLTALFLIANSICEKKTKLNDELKSILLELSYDKEINIRYGTKIKELLKEE